jgi:hypothetical protein
VILIDHKLQKYCMVLTCRYYNLTNESISGRRLHSPDELKQPAPLHLPVFGNNLTQFLASDLAASSLGRLATSLQNSSVAFHIYSSRSRIDKFMRQASTPRSFWNFEMNTWLPWMSCLSFALTLTLLFLWYSTHRRLLILSAALSMGMINKAECRT